VDRDCTRWCFQTFLTRLPNDPQFFVFEGSITLLVPLQEAVFRPEDKEVFPSVNYKVTISIVVFYVAFAMICWTAFGSSVQTALTASLPPGVFTTLVQLAYSLAVLLTFPLQAFPALQVVFSLLGGKEKSNVQRNLLASALVLLLGFIAYISIDYLGNVVSILGSLVGIPIALIFPPLMHNVLVRKHWMNYCVSGLGVFAMGAASFATITSWDKGAEG